MPHVKGTGKNIHAIENWKYADAETQRVAKKTYKQKTEERLDAIESLDGMDVDQLQIVERSGTLVERAWAQMKIAILSKK